MSDISKLPKFSDLPKVGQTEERHTWGVFGPDNQLGSVNLLTPERVKQAATLVRTGRVFNWSLALNFPITLYGGFREFGYYGGRQDVDLDEKGELGIEHWAQHGIVGRGVLLDAARYIEQHGTPLDMTKKFEMDGGFLEQVAQEQKVELQPGDILVLRTGWLSWYKSLDNAGREALRGSLEPGEGGHACPGLDASQDTAAWLWESPAAGCD